MVSSGPPKGMMGNSDSVCSMAHAAGGLFGRGRGYGVRSTGAWEVTGSTCVCGGGGGWRGCALTYQSVNGGKGCWRVLAHTPYKRTQPPPPGDREREHRRETKGKQKAKRQETKRKPRQALDTAETHASVVSASTDGLINRREHQQFFISSTQTWYTKTNMSNTNKIRVQRMTTQVTLVRGGGGQNVTGLHVRYFH